ncbi:preprotein translocase subunit SecG [Jannaschia sp. M317]|uniref:preprotein translocase subunit SecG n=1 Tax=Jannaschia sp. M317 TaxID=2867011 RepID=UPI0021A3BB11|nr:preprotein translocase subunit SecG [Jannaschia sp. M317]UWQ18660.1 preprotein translocase subunit SecG [Jannaschia sp. M317]
MENVLLLIHLIVALCLIGIVLLQRSEGGGLGMGGGGGGAMTGRQAATAMTKLTWLFGTVFLINSIVLTVIAAQNASGGSVVDLVPTEESSTVPGLPSGESLLPPTPDSAPLAPPRSE